MSLLPPAPPAKPPGPPTDGFTPTPPARPGAPLKSSVPAMLMFPVASQRTGVLAALLRVKTVTPAEISMSVKFQVPFARPAMSNC